MDKKNKKSGNAAHSFKEIMVWAYKLRTVLLAIPVAIAAVVLAIRNISALPQNVVFDMPAFSEAGQLIFKTISVGRPVAVIAPLMITILCLIMVFCSKKVVYPWLISLFSLVLPIVLLLINTFPG